MKCTQWNIPLRTTTGYSFTVEYDWGISYFDEQVKLLRQVIWYNIILLANLRCRLGAFCCWFSRRLLSLGSECWEASSSLISWLCLSSGLVDWCMSSTLMPASREYMLGKTLQYQPFHALTLNYRRTLSLIRSCLVDIFIQVSVLSFHHSIFSLPILRGHRFFNAKMTFVIRVHFEIICIVIRPLFSFRIFVCLLIRSNR